MFYACLSILVLLLVILCCVCLSIIDLETYNFGLYIVLLCIVGTMLACALCVANPNACPNPVWYSNFCLMLQEMYPSPGEYDKPHPSSEMNGIRSRMIAMHAGMGAPSSQQPQHSTSGGGGFPLRQESRATVAMLAPAVHIMHQVWRGMAWVAGGIDEEEEDATKSYDQAEQSKVPGYFGGGLLSVGVGSNYGASRSYSQEGTDSAQKRLSTIAESSSSGAAAANNELDKDEVSSEFASGQDIMV